MKIALFRNVVMGYDTILDEERRASGFYTTGYAQISEWVDVSFPPLDAQQNVEGQLNALSDMETELRNQFQGKLNQIATERAKLRALAHTPTTGVPS